GRTIGRRRDRLRAYRTGCLLASPIDDIVGEANEAVARGILAIKMQVGSADVAVDIDRVQAVKASLPAGATLMVDATQAYDVPRAQRAAERFAELGVAWF